MGRKLTPPPGAALGWYLRYDEEVRATRIATGLWVPELTDEDRAYIAANQDEPEPEPYDDEVF